MKSETPKQGLFGWLRAAPPTSRRALVAASLGWMLDSFDVMLYALVLAYLMKDLGMAKPAAGLLGSLTLLASAAGGVLFGLVADRKGRTWALRASVLIYSIFTAACGLAQSVPMLAVFRVCLGLGMGGEWASGAALVSETWPAEHRGKALGFVQSFWAVGYAAAALVTAAVYPRFGWRAVFFIGVLPALLIFWIRAKVEEPSLWRSARAAAATAPRVRVRSVVRGPLFRVTAAVTVMNAFTMFGYWGFNLWIPGYLSLAKDQGGIGLTPRTMPYVVAVMQIGTWFGYLTFGYISDSLGRKKTYVAYLVAAAALVVAYAAVAAPLLLLILGPFVAFFGTGYFSGFGALTAELYPTQVRATLQGFTYNIGRVASAIAPLAVGSLAQRRGFGTAFLLVSGAFVLAAAMWTAIPETKGRVLV
jgi:MFS family permease